MWLVRMWVKSTMYSISQESDCNPAAMCMHVFIHGCKLYSKEFNTQCKQLIKLLHLSACQVVNTHTHTHYTTIH